MRDVAVHFLHLQALRERVSLMKSGQQE
ncbi:hypothetical protein V12B01_12580 [Vibrio splendidus 12B01]|nr:hypothetical protein V12B01_12580 [Vibrio splendidus 12B01]